MSFSTLNFIFNRFLLGFLNLKIFNFPFLCNNFMMYLKSKQVIGFILNQRGQRIYFKF